MNTRTVFINKYGRLRSGWRVLFFVAVAIAIHLLIGVVLWIGYAGILAAQIRVPYAALIANLIYRVVLIVVALGGGYICCRLLEGLPWRSLGLTLHLGWFRDFIVGTLIGILSLGLAVAIAALGGGLHFSFSGADIVWATIRSLAGSAILFVIAALAEEALFRGYPLQSFARAHLAWVGVVLTLLLFASVHLNNPNVVPGFTFTNTAVAGVWLAIAYLRTRSLWLPLGVHWAWNWALGSLFGLPVSGLSLVSHPLLIANDAGPAWLTGGSYGIEGGLAGTIALIASTLFIWRTSLVTSTPEMLHLTSEENPVDDRP